MTNLDLAPLLGYDAIHVLGQQYWCIRYYGSMSWVEIKTVQEMKLLTFFMLLARAR